jgi:hypothetical protein
MLHHHRAWPRVVGEQTGAGGGFAGLYLTADEGLCQRHADRELDGYWGAY